jgi:hypothetical protein
MNRLIVVALLMLPASTAQARRRVIHIPTIGELCPAAAEWTKVVGCIKRQSGVGPIKLLRDDANLKLLHLAEGRFAGLYVYVHRKQWTLLGEMRLYQQFDVLGFAPVKFGEHTGHRLDVGFATQSAVVLDGESTVPAMFRSVLTMLCFDDSHACSLQVMTSCDVIVHGRTFFTFRGQLVYEERQLRLAGDRRNAGQYCTVSEVLLTD